MYKQSIYNNYIKTDENGNTLCLNAATGGLVWFDNEVISAFQSNNIESLSEKEYFQALIDNGYIVKDNIDEYEQYSYRMKKYAMGLSSDSCSFIIALTMKCNLRCLYCFEEGKNESSNISKQTLNDIFSFITKQLEEQNKKKLYINWFGGEPMIAYNSIVFLSHMLIEYCKKNEIEYKSSMVTNATLLDEDKIKNLKNNVNINHMQISIDGDKEWYSKLKRADNEKYETVFQNILLAAKNGIGVSVRLNICKENQESLMRFVDKLIKEPDFHGIIYTGKLMKYNNSQDYHEISDDDLTKFEATLEKKISKYAEYKKFLKKSLKPKGAPCGYMVTGRCLIDNEGYLYRCEHHIANKNLAIGDVIDGFYHNKIDNQFLFSPLPEKCQKCSIMPLCAGGCISDRILHDKWISCDYMKNKINRTCSYLSQNI